MYNAREDERRYYGISRYIIFYKKNIYIIIIFI